MGAIAAMSLATGLEAASPAKLSGAIVGEVRSATGVAQMGATVFLFNRYDQLVRKVLSNENGGFGFDFLTPDLYSIRVQLASFVPAERKNISVQAGGQSFLTIQLASLFSSIELVYSGPGRGTLMTDEWRWTLKGSVATRPVLRVLPGRDSSGTTVHAGTPAFADTQGLVRVGAADGVSLAGGGGAQDLGTAFALATSLFGVNRMKVSGNVGYAAGSALPTAGFRTTYSREAGGVVSPEVTVTMRQVALPLRAGLGALTGGSAPALRTMSVSTYDRLQLTDRLAVEYGASLESISFLNRLNYMSPFGRLTYDLGRIGSIQAAFSSGVAPADLIAQSRASETELQQDLSALATLPRLSIRDGQARVQRTENFELGFQRVAGSRTYRAAVFHEAVKNAAAVMNGGEGLVASEDLLPDIASRASIFNLGNYDRLGYMLAVDQRLGERMQVGIAAGYAGALRTTGEQLETADADQLRSLLRKTNRPWVSARASAVIPGSGTRLNASYGWSDFRVLMPVHQPLTQTHRYEELGWNMAVRQPLPSFRGLPGRLEAVAEARNLLGQGYLPVSSSGGRKAEITQNPRMLRGSLSLIF